MALNRISKDMIDPILVKEISDAKSLATAVNASPKGVYPTLAALQAAFPTGNSNLYVVTADGKWYYWSGSAWAAGGVYQSTALEPIDLTKTTFAKTGKNLFDKSKAQIDKSVNATTGAIVTDTLFYASEYMEVEPNTEYKKTTTHTFAYYDANKNFISGVAASANLLTPANCKYVVVSIVKSAIDTFQLEKGTVSTSYEAFKRYIPNTIVEKQPITANDIPPIPPEALSFTRLSTNLFDKSKAVVNKSIDLYTGLEKDGTGFGSSGFVPVDPLSKFIISTARGIIYYDASKARISHEADSTPKTNVVITTPANAKYVRFYWYDTVDMTGRINGMQVNKGDTLLPYEPFAYKLPKENLDLTNLQETIGVEINLPDKIYGVVGKQISVYFNNLLDVPVEEYMVDVTCSVGMQEKRRWVATPTDAGTFPLTITLYKNYKLVKTKKIDFVVKAATVGSGTKNVIVIGDSTINQARPTQRLLDLAATDPMKVALFGTRGTVPNNHEGRGGWTFAQYRTNSQYLGTANPFYNSSTTDFDFSYYMTNQGYAVPNYVILCLGINDTFGFTTDSSVEAAIDAIFVNADFIVNNIKAFNASIKIGLCLTIPPNENQDAFALSYKNDQTQWRYKRNNAIWVKRLIAKYGKREAENIYLIPDNNNIDCLNGFDTVDGGGVHPNATGDNQRGDSFYYWLKSFEA